MSEVRLKWFSMLANLTYPTSPGQAAEAFKAYLPMLADLPDGAFTKASLEAVCEFPHKMALRSYDEIRTPLRSWWRDNRPFQAALPAPVIPDRIPPTEEERAVVTALTQQAVGILAEAIDAKRGGKSDTPVKPSYLNDRQRLIDAELAIDKYRGAEIGTQNHAFLSLAIMRRDAMRAKLGDAKPPREVEPDSTLRPRAAA